MLILSLPSMHVSHAHELQPIAHINCIHACDYYTKERFGSSLNIQSHPIEIRDICNCHLASYMNNYKQIQIRTVRQLIDILILLACIATSDLACSNACSTFYVTKSRRHVHGQLHAMSFYIAIDCMHDCIHEGQYIAIHM